MRSAVYYPHTEIQSVGFLKSCLLLWDRVDLIVPHPEYNFDRSRREFAQAIDLLCGKLVPSEQQKAEAHDLIEEFAARQLPEEFFYFPGQHSHYMTRGVWPQKFLFKTWRMLEEAGFTDRLLANGDYPMQDAAAMTIMSLLADCCAGDAFARVTDRVSAYASITNLLRGLPDQEGEDHPSEYAIVPVTLNILNLSKISLGQLIHYRRREEMERGHSLRDLRHNYSDRIACHVSELKHITRPSDRREATRQFREDLSTDLRDLKSELRSNVLDISFSKEVIITTLAVAGSAFSASHLGLNIDINETATYAGRAIALGGLAAVSNRYLQNRLAALRRHPMAYLYELNRRG